MKVFKRFFSMWVCVLAVCSLLSVHVHVLDLSWSQTILKDCRLHLNRFCFCSGNCGGLAIKREG